MSRGCRKDNNHDEIVSVFEELQCFVLDIHRAGQGLPDLLVKCLGLWHPVEIKSATWYGKRGLSKLQQTVSADTYDIIRTRAEAEALVEHWRTGSEC